MELVNISSTKQPASVTSLPLQGPSSFSSADDGASLAHLSKIIGKHKWKLIVFVSASIAAAVALSLTLPKLYEATALVKVDRHSVSGVVGQEASQTSSVDDMDQIITTQIELAQSDPVLRPIATKYHLLEVEKQLNGLNAQEILRKKAAPIDLRRLKVTRPPNTYLIRITYRANDPQLAAAVANAIAESLVIHANDTGNHSYVEVSALINHDMSDLRKKMEVSSGRLAEFQKELNIVDPEQRTTMLTARLTQLNTELTAAEADRLQKEAILEGVKKTRSLAAVQAAEATSQRSLLENALERLDSARQQFASVKAFYGEKHPEYRKAKEQLDEVQSEVDRLQANSAEKVEAEYQQALGRESRLRAVIQQTKADVDNLQARAIQYEQLKSEAENDKKLYEDLETRTREADINNQFQNATIQVFAPARPPNEQIFPKMMINVPVAFVLACILGILGSVLADAMDTTFSDPEEVAGRVNIDVLAAIPAVRRLPRNTTSSRSMDDDAQKRVSQRSAELTGRYLDMIRVLRSAITLATIDQPARTILMTSANPGEGKSTTAANLAVSFAQLGKRVLLVDADLRRPALHNHFELSSRTGLSDVLARGVPVSDAMVKFGDQQLYVIPAGPVTSHPADLISVGFSSVMHKISQEFDVVIVDGPPLLAAAEAQDLAGFVDGVIIVTKAGSTKGQSVAETVGVLSRLRANILGMVMNQVKSSGSHYSYYSSNVDVKKEAA